MKTPISLRIDEPLFERLHTHLFPGDGDEHGAVIAAGITETGRGTRLLAREVFLARDGVDYVPGKRGYRMLTAQFVADKSGYCAEQKLCYLAVHNHGGRDSVKFSGDDMRSHERGYPALLDITGGGPVGALVFAENAVAGDIWTPEGRRELEYLTVIGPRVHTLYPQPPARSESARLIYDRHARLFGDAGQEILGGLKVGIIGLGGGGSLLNSWLARLGVGHIVGVDFDRLHVTNHPRVEGATRWDELAFLQTSGSALLRRLGERLARHKVYVARRVARRATPSIRYDAVVGSVLDEPVARLLSDCDFIFLASDTIQSRLVFNALVHQYLIPGAQVGAKVPVDPKTGEVGDIFVATRPVLPYPYGGCLDCHGLIPAARLQDEALSEGERRAQRYVDSTDVAEPSVITLNALSAAQAANDLMMMFTGLYHGETVMPHHVNFVRERVLHTVEPVADEFCLHCGSHARSRRARGDRARLPCRAPATR
ncbi:MAG TPA: ThiF family adenylyltransferase [Pyrinomonadaceae bacterium]|nr:ThiF family adenylyltransferase [Pyrinomonadaceae bacterium]